MDAETRQFFDIVLQKLDKVDSRLDKVDSRLDKVDARLDKVDARLDKVDSRLDRLESRLDRLESQQDSMHERLIQNTKAIRDLKQHTDSGFDTLINMIESLDHRKMDKIAQ